MINDEAVIQWLQTIAIGTLPLYVDNVGLATHALEMLSLQPAPAPEPALPVGNISKHFTWDEFLYSETAVEGDIENTPNDAAKMNLEALAEVMEEVRALCGDNPVIITSGYRAPDVNAAVGGVPDSAHQYGCAADFVIPEYGTVAKIIAAIQPSMGGLGIDQLIYEGTWVHLGLPVPPADPRYECFTA